MRRRNLLAAGASCGLLSLLQEGAWSQSRAATDGDPPYPPLGPADDSPANVEPLVRTGINVELSAADVFGRPVTVWADRVRILGAVATAGYSLTIVAREIEFTPNSHIDARSIAPVPHFPKPNRAGSGGAPGSAGENGSNGGDGRRAGDVELVAQTVSGKVVIDARGQRGGDAQSGGDGQRGANAPGYPPRQLGNHCKKGRTGGAGGLGGLTGRPGYGGNGGNISVIALEVEDRAPRLLVEGGAAGEPGSHGRPGPGGDGGKGGGPLYNNDSGPHGKMAG